MLEEILEGWPTMYGIPQPATNVELIPEGREGRGRWIFLAFYPDPPWRCEFCGDDILVLGKIKGSLHVHHANEDRNDNRLINLVPSHASCHVKHHARLRKIDFEKQHQALVDMWVGRLEA
jgi:hypothetical protein